MKSSLVFLIFTLFVAPDFYALNDDGSLTHEEFVAMYEAAKGEGSDWCGLIGHLRTAPSVEAVRRSLLYTQVEENDDGEIENWNFLHVAASQGNLVVSRLLMAWGLNFAAENGERSPLQVALAYGERDFVREVLDDDVMNTLALNAIRAHDFDVIRVLFRGTYRLPGTFDEHGLTLLEHAVVAGNIDIIAFLLERLAYDLTAVHGRRMVGHAVAGGDENLVLFLIDRDLGFEAADWGSLFNMFLQRNMVQAIQHMNARGLLDLDGPINSDGVTLLMHFAGEGNVEMVNYLLMRGANSEARDIMGFTALEHAQRAGQVAIIDLLQPLREAEIAEAVIDVLAPLELGDIDGPAHARFYVDGGCG